VLPCPTDVVLLPLSSEERVEGEVGPVDLGGALLNARLGTLPTDGAVGGIVAGSDVYGGGGGWREDDGNDP